MRGQKMLLELTWWLVTALLAVLVILPIRQNCPAYPFTVINVIYVIVFVTLTRYLFQWKFSIWGRLQWLKFLLVFLTIPLLFLLINAFNDFLSFLDDYTLDSILDHLPREKREGISRYIRTEMIFFAVGSVITALIWPFRMIGSIWRQRNRGTI